MWKELTAEDLRAKAAGRRRRDPAGRLDGAARAASAGRRRHLPVRGRVPGGAERCRRRRPVVVAPTLWCGMAEHHMAFGGTFTFDIPTYRAVLLLLPEEHRAPRLQARIHRQRPRRQHRRAQCLPARLRPRDRPDSSASPPTSTVARMTIAQFLEDQEARAPRLRGRDLDDDGGGARHRAARQARRGARAAAFDAASPPASRATSRSRRSPRRGVIGDARRASAQKGEKLVAAMRRRHRRHRCEDRATWG